MKDKFSLSIIDYYFTYRIDRALHVNETYRIVSRILQGKIIFVKEAKGEKERDGTND